METQLYMDYHGLLAFLQGTFTSPSINLCTLGELSELFNNLKSQVQQEFRKKNQTVPAGQQNSPAPSNHAELLTQDFYDQLVLLPFRPSLSLCNYLRSNLRTTPPYSPILLQDTQGAFTPFYKGWPTLRESCLTHWAKFYDLNVIHPLPLKATHHNTPAYALTISHLSFPRCFFLPTWRPRTSAASFAPTFSPAHMRPPCPAPLH